MQTRRESDYLNAARLAEIALAASLVWMLVSMLRGRGLEDPDFHFFVFVSLGLLSPLAPGLYFLIRVPRQREWVYICLMHQAFVIVSGSLALIFLLSTLIPSAAPISETWPVVVFCALIAGIQIPIAFVARYFLRNASLTSKNWKVPLMRTGMVLYFAALFLLLK